MPQTTRYRRVECESCGCIARMTRKALAGSGVPFCGCGAGRMLITSLEDAAAVLSDDALTSHPAYRADAAAEARRAIRAHTGAGNRHQCGGCRVFIPAVNHHCRCGFQNDIRGGRNEGRWVEGSSRCVQWEQESKSEAWGF